MNLKSYVKQELQSINFKLCIAKIRTVIAKGHWNSFVKSKARSLGIELPTGFNPEAYISKAVKNKLSKAPVEEEEATEWCLAYLFIPQALNSDAEDLFSKFQRKNTDGSGNFAGYFSSYVPNAIKQFQRLEGQKLENKWDDDDVQQLENKVKNLENKYKHEITTDPDTKEKIPFGLSGADIEKLHSLTDMVNDIAFSDLKKDLLKYVKENDHSSNQFSYKIIKLKFIDPEYSQQELAEILKTTPKTISISINKNLKKLVAEYAAHLKKNYNDNVLFRAMLRLDLVPEGVTARRTAAIASYIHCLCDKLETAFM